MTGGSIAFMLIICGVVWGGFIFCLFTLARQNDEEES